MLILLYHDIVKTGTKKMLYSIDEAFFREQISYLKNKGYKFLSLGELVYLIQENKPLSPKIVVLTFDDGRLGQFKLGFKILKELDLPATFFITVKDIGRANYMSWEDLRILKENNMEIGSHGLSHLSFELLSEEEILKELRCSKEILEDKLNIKIEFLSLPCGFFERKKIKTLATKVGYRAVCSSKIGYIDSKADLFFLKRFFLKKTDTLNRFIGIVERNPFILFSYKINESLRLSLRNMLGLKNYEKIRRLFLREEYIS